MYGRIKDLCGKDFKERVALVHSDMKSYYLEDSIINGKNYDFVYAQYSKQLSLPITVCTPDQIFDFALKYAGYEYKLAVASYSKFIIDEIQMYSPDVLAAVIYAIKMIHMLGGKVAVLTATLPPFVKNELEKIFGEDVKTADFSDKGKLKHNVKVQEKALQSDDIIKIFNDTKCDKVKKYLVVCNSIDIANKMYLELKNSEINADINLFHSNFTKNDRKDKENEILKASEKPNESMNIPEIWISTSVVEASLDIDFDILITELSDLFSLFQRFGRVNRRAKKDFSTYNCFVFTEIQGNAHYFVDDTIHALSKQAVLNVDGVISEEEKKKLLLTLKGKENITLDGQKILLYANIGNIKDLAAVMQNDAGGIGLFRSEFIYLEQDHYPTEEEQFRIYKQAAETMAGKRVIIRTLDIGADKQCDYFEMEKEENPALGCRAIRICLTRPEIFKTQLRALFRASAYGKIAIMYPMITSVGEVRQIKAIVEEVKASLAEQGIEYGNPEQGIMIETPAAAIISDELAKEVDFFSIGTNDLSQYTLAIDRQNTKLDPFFDPHHPAILRMIQMVVENAHKSGIWAGICGELGADQELTKEFLAMGVDELSVSPGSILPLRKIILETNVAEYKAGKKC